jgi:hypothetical protein
LFGDREKEVFERILQKQAGFCGLELLAYCMMSNHFHILVRVPARCEISDEELLRRYRILYGGEHCPFSAPSPEVLEELLRDDSEEGQEWRERVTARMHDLQVFMRELKQRFGIWYNHQHQNKGTLWGSRFKSTLVEDEKEALSTVAAYIDLNPVRAQIVDDPAEYRHSSYGRAMGGDRRWRNAYEGIYFRDWSSLIESYNMVLYGKGEQVKGEISKDQGVIDPEKARRIIENKGKLPLSQALRLRVRYFTDGAAIGSKAYLEELGQTWKQEHNLGRKHFAHPMQSAYWNDLRSYRNLKVRPVG